MARWGEDNVNGVNAVTLALQGPSLPSIAVIHHNGPYSIEPGSALQDDTQNVQNTLEPRPAIIGSVDALPLQPKYLPNFDRECRSEPRDLPKSEEHLNILKSQQFPSTYFSGKSPSNITETGISLASVPAIAIGSSTEVLVSIVENQVNLRRNSMMVGDLASRREDKNSPDFDNVKSPSTEFTTSSLQSTPIDDSVSRLDSVIFCDKTEENNIESYTV